MTTNPKVLRWILLVLLMLKQNHTSGDVASYLGKVGITIVFVTHDIDEAVLLADRIVVMGVNLATLKRSDVPLQRPRSSESTFLDEFRDIKLQVLKSIREETDKLMVTV